MKLRSAILLLAVVLALVPANGLLPRDTPASNVLPYRYGLLSWEVRTLSAKAVQALGGQLFPPKPMAGDVEPVKRYFALAVRQQEVLRDLERAAAARADTSGIEEELAGLRKEQAALEDRVEAIIAAQVKEAVGSEGLFRGPRRNILFPPVLLELDPLPDLLVLSPRARIEIEDTSLVSPGLSVSTQEHLERQQEKLGRSSLVTGIGGLATYPSLVSATSGLRFALGAVAHEWLHHYLAFQPLGRQYGANGDLTSLNETVAELFGDEIGARLYHEFYGGPPPPPLDRRQEPGDRPDPGQFDFTREMRQTRVRAEELLREGLIYEAESYMEERRQLFLANGYYLRKLNQAYFAFHGSYAESPASVSPLGAQVRSLRLSSASLGDFVRTVERFSRFEDFVARATSLGDSASTRP